MQIDNIERIKELLSCKRMNKKFPEPGNNIRGVVNLINEYYQPNFTVVEIGSYEGVVTEVFAIACEKVYAIDCWKDNDIPEQDGIENLTQAEKIFDERIKNYPNVTKIRKLSSVAYLDFKDLSIDAIYIDGNHSDSGVTSDISLWSPKVKIGGIIAGHDYSYVKNAVNKILGKPLKIYEDTSFVFIKK